MGVYTRGRKLWITFRDVDGLWKNRATGYGIGDEKRAQAVYDAVTAAVRAARDGGATSGPLTVEGYVPAWLERRRELGLDWKNDEGRLRQHVLPVIGELQLDQVRARHLVDLFTALRTKSGLAPKTIHNVYGVIKALFRDAKLAGLITEDPCVLKKYELGPNEDKDPEWRATAVFTRAEVERLIADPAIPSDRQLLYALGALAGLRHGEAAGLRWRHYDASVEPLARLLIATSYDKGRTKTKRPRQVPVHPTLAAMLAEWKLHGWERMMGRAPAPDDLVIPLELDPAKKRARANPREGGMRSKNDSRKRWLGDLAALELRHRRGHDLRATFITLAIDDGAEPYILERVTHTPKRQSAFDGYSRTQWETLCREVAKLRISRSARGDVIALPQRIAAGHRGGGGDDRASSLQRPYSGLKPLQGHRKTVEAPGVERGGIGREDTPSHGSPATCAPAVSPSVAERPSAVRSSLQRDAVAATLEEALSAWRAEGDVEGLRDRLAALLARLG